MLNESSPIRVILVDDHDQVRRGLSVFLRAFPDFHLVAEARNGLEAIELCHTNPIDVVIMDIIMPEMNGIEATQTLHRLFPQLKIIALTSYDDKEMIQKMLDAGAVHYIPKDVSAAELAQAIRTVTHL